MAVTHVCNLRSAWPIGHPLPPEDPAKLTGPEEGTYCLYQGKSYGSRFDPETGTMVRDPDPDPIIVRVIRRSYVWSPGECRHGGGYRHYDWSVIEEGPFGYRSVVVDDDQLTPLPACFEPIPGTTYGTITKEAAL